jgi:hypothetical protein
MISIIKQHPDIINMHLFFNLEWNYFATFTLQGDDISSGDCYLALHDNMSRLQKIDSEIDFLFYICQRDIFERPHIHGVMRSSLPARKIEKAWRGGIVKQVVLFNPDKAKALYGYMKEQSLGQGISRDSLLGGVL